MEGEKTTTEGTTNEPKQEVSGTTKASGRNGKLALAVVLLIVLGVLAWAGMQIKNRDGANEEVGEISFDTAAPLPSFDNIPDVVAKVGSVELTKNDYVEAYTQSWQMMAQQGVSMNSAEAQSGLASQVLDILVNAELLAQAATAAGVAVSDDEVAEEVGSLKEQFGGEEGLAEALAEVGMDANMLRENIAEQILIETYLKETSEMSGVSAVTDADVEARYNEVAAQGSTELPPLADVADIIRMQLEAEAEQATTDAVVERLRAAAEVELYMNLEEV